MVVYLEALLGVNSLIHYNFSILSYRFFNYHYRKIRIIISIILDNVLVLLSTERSLLYERYIIIFIVSMITFGKKFKPFILYLLLNFLLGGIAGLWNLGLYYQYLLIIVLSYGLIALGEIYISNSSGVRNLYHEIIINGHNILGFLDTGNDLMVDGIPVIFLKKYIDLPFYKTIKYKTVMGSDKLDIYLGNIFINDKEVKCFIAFKDIDYECLLNVNLLKMGDLNV